MAKRESKGQRAKTFKHYTPDENGDCEAETVVVYLQVGEHLCFVAWLPKHIGTALPALECYAPNHYFKGSGKVQFDERVSTVRSTSIDSLIDAYDTACRQYQKMLTERSVVPVLHVEFKANLPYDRERANQGDYTFGVGSGCATGSADISFCPSPAIALVVQKLWREPGKMTLYHKRIESAFGDRQEREFLEYNGASLGHWGQGDPKARAKWEASVIPWTQEREDFLRGIVANITKLGWMMKDFLKDFEGNITYTLENGSKSLMLAPPKREEPKTDPLGSVPPEFDASSTPGSAPVIRHRERTRTR